MTTETVTAQHTITYYGLTIPPELHDGLIAQVDPIEWQLIKQYLRPDDRVVVAGGGQGAQAALIAAVVGPENVVAYEPNRPMAIRARDQIRVAGQRLDIRHAALATISGEVLFYHSGAWPASSIVSAMVHDPIGTYIVPAVDIVTAVEERAATFLALDVEGAEYDLLPHLCERVNVRTIVVETHGDPERDDTLESAMEQRGFECVRRETYPTSDHAVLVLRQIDDDDPAAIVRARLRDVA